MSYKETLFFVAKCLTITLEEKNFSFVKDQIEAGQVDWDAVVKVSTAHYVFPALYCNLKRKELLGYLPEDLVSYMEHITSLNRERNEQIIIQAKEINSILEAYNIRPIFLKGTGFLLQGFYEDIAERMVGDIDFIVSSGDYESSVEILKTNGYKNKPHRLENVKLGKHYPRLIHENRIAAIEVHFRIIKEPYDQSFNYETIKNDIVRTNDTIYVLGNEHQLLHVIFNKQTNDYGYWYKTFSLRNSYDLFLLSKKTNTLEVIQSFKKHFNILNAFLASCNLLFNRINSITFLEDKASKKYVKRQLELLDSAKKMKSNKRVWELYFNTKSRSEKLKLAFMSKDMRYHFFDLLKKKLN